MPEMITDPDDYFEKGCGRCARADTPDCSTRTWIDGLSALRRICREAGLEETAKWGHPCYVHAGRNIVIMGAFRGDFRLTFFNPGLMRDPEGLLSRQGANTRHPDMIRFDRVEQVGELAPAIRAYLAEAMGYAEAGLRQPKATGEIELPEELVEALDADPELAEAFHGLTPGRQKSYAIALASARKPETRLARIEKFRAGIFAGKGANER